MICMIVFCISVLSFVFFFKQKTAYEMRISDWSSDVCSSDLPQRLVEPGLVLVDVERRHLGRVQDAEPIHADLDLSGWKLRVDCPLGTMPDDALHLDPIGRASCRERVCQYV